MGGSQGRALTVERRSVARSTHAELVGMLRGLCKRCSETLQLVLAGAVGGRACPQQYRALLVRKQCSADRQRAQQRRQRRLHGGCEAVPGLRRLTIAYTLLASCSVRDVDYGPFWQRQ